MKKYDGLEMIKDSRFIVSYKQLSESDKEAMERRVNELAAENKSYCDKGNYRHLCNIFSSMALYYVLSEGGIGKNEAADRVFEDMYAFVKPKRLKMQKMFSKDWFWPVIKKIVPIGFKMGSGTGWAYTWFEEEDKNDFRFECNSCIYQQIFEKYGLPEFGPRFCHVDVIIYGDLPQTDFIRTGTVCRGDGKCDFRFVRYHKGEAFTRHKSV